MAFEERRKLEEKVETGNDKRESPARIKSPKEDILTSREKTSSKKIGRGVTDSSFIELKDDGKGVFKTEYYQNERAAYLIDRFLGFNLTPPTAIRTLDGEIGSMQEFIPDAQTFHELEEDFRTSFEEEHRADFMKMWLFDIIINNFDRHSGNFLVQGNTLYAIDHGYSMNHHWGNRSFLYRIYLLNGFRYFLDQEFPKEIINNIKNFLERPEEQQILRELLAELFDEDTVSVLLKRIKIVGEILVKNGQIGLSQSDSPYIDIV